MKENELNLLLDNLIIRSSNKDLYNLLSYKQKIMGALELLIGTATRSGVEVFFEHYNQYLWQDALTGLEAVDAHLSRSIYETVLRKLESKKIKMPDYKKLQNALVVNEFDIIYSGVRKYVLENLDEFKSIK